MKDLKLKHITGAVKLKGKVTFYQDDFGNTFCPTVADFKTYKEDYVVRIDSDANGLNIHLRNEI